ncbi:DUF2304 domain-containing protein [Cellulomonas dongxiuzhuiae]|uniref:DUF2304 domain-containing protein n=1 Tax=Cellulomonas dongxiuzhuiae TaxID=2819979 RepID=A0ABX8GGI6_9CELL|nr:DUF2304 domain-containing protein [Cellulomonas dongxiuzhuiae]MBO3086711.1 DUF2304 domain-containing protein [Cellulomonas dongxiuzhuiae]MBO3093936.1 DUF2304 domain-containing protein [Cellulomonas dongxiuzhuiae]QWC15018.1 DUF2304 domain-containing protein [Cellulomonas dongxiuzhuiae]
MSGYLFAVALSVVVLLFIVQLLRRRRLREKYAGIWLVVSLAIIVLALFPGLAVALARVVGVETPSNLLFATSLGVLLLVTVQLSTEVSGLEEETRTLAEASALLAERLTHVERWVDGDAHRQESWDAAAPDAGAEHPERSPGD